MMKWVVAVAYSVSLSGQETCFLIELDPPFEPIKPRYEVSCYDKYDTELARKEFATLAAAHTEFERQVTLMQW